MELELLKVRFPDDPLVNTCGNLVNEFFCARAVDSHSYEGRIFVTEKAFFFVSSFSVAASYDVSFSNDVISQVVAYQRIIPSIEFTLNDKKEEFKNFHDLPKVLSVIKKLLSERVEFDIRKQAYLSRLVSVPNKDPLPPPKLVESKSNNRICPYFSQSGFCPRKEFCHLVHDLTLPPLPSSVTSSPLESVKQPQFLRSISTPATTLVPSIAEIPLSEEPDHSTEEVTNEEEISEKVTSLRPSNWSDDVAIPSPRALNREDNHKEKEEEEEVAVKRKDGAADIFNTRPLSTSSSISDTGEKVSPPECYYEYGSGDESGEDIPAVEIPSKLKVFPATMIARPDINAGDKVILFPEILMACEQKEISYPMAFCFENTVNKRLVYAGVLEFSNPTTNTAFLPQWMFDHLGVTEGEEVDFKHVDLPKGTFIQLQPVSAAWLSVPYDKRAAVMEFQLRNFQTLTEGTKVSIMYELNRYSFKVLKCKPAKGISIVDADITTDFIEPADLNRFHSIEEGQAENIPLDEPLPCTLAAGQYRHFVLLSLFGHELPPNLTVEVTQESGDPDLFLCQTRSTPTQSRYTWCCQTSGNSVIVLGEDDKDYKREKSLFAGVVSLCEDTSFTICFRSNSASTISGLGGGHVLRSATGSSGISGEEEEDRKEDGTATTTTTVDIPPGHEQCFNCGSVMPQLRLLMHSRHCEQSNFKCPICKQCFPKSFEKKHHFISHELLTCECGVEMTQLSLHHHQLTDCVKRSVRCQFKWCQLSYPLDQMEEHENRCGRKLVTCPVCSEDVPQLELEMHLEGLHLVEVEKLDWTRPLSSQQMTFTEIEPNYKCHCGKGFEYEDDLQVHQLTDCTSQPSEPKPSSFSEPIPSSFSGSSSDSEDIVG